MNQSFSKLYWISLSVGIAACMSNFARGQEPDDQLTLLRPVLPKRSLTIQPNQHPLIPTVRMADQGREYIRQNVRDYTCLLIKRERVNGVGRSGRSPAHLIPMGHETHFEGPLDRVRVHGPL